MKLMTAYAVFQNSTKWSIQKMKVSKCNEQGKTT